jgi:hypothetical protein
MWPTPVEPVAVGEMNTAAPTVDMLTISRTRDVRFDAKIAAGVEDIAITVDVKIPDIVRSPFHRFVSRTIQVRLNERTRCSRSGETAIGASP